MIEVETLIPADPLKRRNTSIALEELRRGLLPSEAKMGSTRWYIFNDGERPADCSSEHSVSMSLQPVICQRLRMLAGFVVESDRVTARPCPFHFGR